MSYYGILYQRVRAEQADHAEQIINDQKREAHRTCEGNYVNIVREYSEVSGAQKWSELTEFKKLLAHLRRNRRDYDYIIVWDYHRITMDYTDYQKLLEVLDKLEIKLFQLRPNYYWPEYDDFIDDSNRDWFEKKEYTDHRKIKL